MLHNVQSTSSSILDIQDNNFPSASPTSKTGKSRNIDYNLNYPYYTTAAARRYHEDKWYFSSAWLEHEIGDYAKVMYKLY